VGNSFELLSLPSRPWIDPDTLQQRFLALAAITHPDATGPLGARTEPSSADMETSSAGTNFRPTLETAGGTFLSAGGRDPSGDGSALTFSELNAAKRLLSDPVQRLRHLLELQAPEWLESMHLGHPMQLMARSPEMEEQFMVVATLLREVSAFRSQQSASISALQRAVLKAEHATFRRDVERTLSRLDQHWERCESQIRALDCVWERRTPEMLRELAFLQREMSFLQKWRAQLREARLQLEI
jgi:hypothetical protein